MRFAAVLLVAARMVYGDAGVLIPGGHDVPDAGVFALQEMSIDIFVDNGTARVRMREIFANQTDRVQEGEYHFALPSGAAVSDFAVWDDVTRIPGVILERKRAGELYEQIKAQSIDPGLLEMGERGADEARRNAMFTAKIVPVPAHGTKRIEIEYQEPVGVDGLRSVLAVPIHPDVYSAITAGQLTASITVQSAHAIQDFAGIGKAYRLQIREKNANAIRADFSGANVALTEDFAFGFAYAASDTDMLRVITEREEGDGFFGARALLSQPVLADKAAGRTVIALFDTSLSMQWDKLERSFAACETLLKRLRPEDSFNLLLFNGNVAAWSTAPKPATPANVEGALAFIRASKIRGGTDIEKAVDAAVAQTREASGESYIVLISDGGANEGTVNNARLAERVGARLRAIAETRRPHLSTFAVGDDANLPLMRSLAANNGVCRVGAVDGADRVQAQRVFVEDRAAADQRVDFIRAAAVESRLDLRVGAGAFCGVGGDVGGAIPAAAGEGELCRFERASAHASDDRTSGAGDRSSGTSTAMGQGAGGCVAGEDRARRGRPEID